LAFQITFTLLPATIAVVGLATIMHAAKFRDPSPDWRPARQATSSWPPSSKVSGRSGGARTALLFGAVATLVSAATAMDQVEHGANRIYGVEQDRPPLHKC
jgi:uncharacterized BrkB/YihY/UPF0761 family membrane protein